MPPKFFITHSHRDNEFVQRLADDLKAVGLEGFLDIYSLRAGDLISREISRGLEACDIYMPVLSHAALDSPWCELEIHTAITLSNEWGRKGRPRIIPLLVEECEARLDPFLRSRLYLKFHEGYDSAFLNLLRAVGVGGAIGQIKPPAERATPPPKIITPPERETGHDPHTGKPESEIIAPESKIIIPTAKTLPSRLTNKAGQEMILIPAGEFLMGSNDADKEARDNEKPQHTVYLDAFYISLNLVTNGEYKRFVEATKHRAPGHWKKGSIPNSKEEHPVVIVDWNDAVDFCKWAGGWLPTEAQWEKAASWDEAYKRKRRYPWGDAFDASKCNSYESNIGDTTPVGKYSPQGDSAYGVRDMAGNVWDWCADWYDDRYYEGSPGENPPGAASGNYCVVRGGAFGDGSRLVRCAFRSRLYPYFRHPDRGFRVVLAPAASEL